MTAAGALLLLLGGWGGARPELDTVLSSFREQGFDCATRSPEGYVQWCLSRRYPEPSVHVGLGCDGPLVNDVSLRLGPAGDKRVTEVPDAFRRAFEDPSLQVPADAAAWLEECVAATGSESLKPENLRVDSVRLKCIGTPLAPSVVVTYLTDEGRAHRDGRKCESQLDPEAAPD